MSSYAILPTRADPAAALSAMLQNILSGDLLDAVLVAAKTPYSALPMPTLFADPAKIKTADPLASVAEIFRTVAAQTQTLYNYEPGRAVSEPIPLLVFEEKLEHTKKNESPSRAQTKSGA
jgi:hypothetical protein